MRSEAFNVGDLRRLFGHFPEHLRGHAVPPNAPGFVDLTEDAPFCDSARCCPFVHRVLHPNGNRNDLDIGQLYRAGRAVECKARFGAVPVNELIDCVVVCSLAALDVGVLRTADLVCSKSGSARTRFCDLFLLRDFCTFGRPPAPPTFRMPLLFYTSPLPRI